MADTTRPNHLLSIADLTPHQVVQLVERASALKRGARPGSLQGKVMALVFEKQSLRTRVSFEVAMLQMGGHAIYLDQKDIGLGVREPVADIARVLSRMVDVIVARTYRHETLEELARSSSVPVVNALSDREHPCQALADLQTVLERFGRLQGLTLAFVGDGNNVASSLALACASVGMHFRIASPRGYTLPPFTLRVAKERAGLSGGSVTPLEDPASAVRGADVVYTDVWVSMGQESEAERRRQAFQGYQVNEALLSLASPRAVLMHPMPAHYGEEVPPGFLEHPASVAFEQAENRLHAQKALLEALLAP